MSPYYSWLPNAAADGEPAIGEERDQGDDAGASGAAARGTLGERQLQTARCAAEAPAARPPQQQRQRGRRGPGLGRVQGGGAGPSGAAPAAAGDGAVGQRTEEAADEDGLQEELEEEEGDEEEEEDLEAGEEEEEEGGDSDHDIERYVLQPPGEVLQPDSRLARLYAALETNQALQVRPTTGDTGLSVCDVYLCVYVEHQNGKETRPKRLSYLGIPVPAKCRFLDVPTH